MHDNNEDGVWAIVADAGGKKYIGRLIYDIPPKDSADIIGAMTDGIPVKMVSAWSFVEMDLVIPGPQGPQGIQHMTHARPANNCQGASDFHIVPTLIHFFWDMKEADQQRNKDLVGQAEENSMRNRADKANIALAGPGAPLPSPPGGFRGPGRPPGLS